MGGLTRALFGGSKSTQQSQSTSTSESEQASNSYNQAYDQLSEALGGDVGTGSQATGALADLLGLNGAGANSQAFDNYKGSVGYNQQFDEGMRALTVGGANSGSLGSGKTGKAYAKFGQGLQAKTFNDYLDRLLGVSKQGNESAGILSSAGNVSSSYGNSNSNSQSTGSGQSTSYSGGLGKFIGAVAASDPRLKENIVHVGKIGDLNVYDFDYVWWGERQRGYMADEVSLYHPEALGPLMDGKYMTVDYSKLPSIEGV